MLCAELFGVIDENILDLFWNKGSLRDLFNRRSSVQNDLMYLENLPDWGGPEISHCQWLELNDNFDGYFAKLSI